jgi:hypothetical protein
MRNFGGGQRSGGARIIAGPVARFSDACGEQRSSAPPPWPSRPTALSPLDGRYRDKLSALARCARVRAEPLVRAEIEWPASPNGAAEIRAVLRAGVAPAPRRRRGGLLGDRRRSW